MHSRECSWRLVQIGHGIKCPKLVFADPMRKRDRLDRVPSGISALVIRIVQVHMNKRLDEVVVSGFTHIHLIQTL